MAVTLAERRNDPENPAIAWVDQDRNLLVGTLNIQTGVVTLSSQAIAKTQTAPSLAACFYNNKEDLTGSKTDSNATVDFVRPGLVLTWTDTVGIRYTLLQAETLNPLTQTRLLKEDLQTSFATASQVAVAGDLKKAKVALGGLRFNREEGNATLSRCNAYMAWRNHMNNQLFLSMVLGLSERE
jgi:hypothetical protein